MPLKNFQKIIDETPDSLKIQVEDSMLILERLNELLEEKFEGKQKLLAEKMGKSEAEVSKMLNGVQNYTLKTLAKLSEAFGERIIRVTASSPKLSESARVKSVQALGAKSAAPINLRIKAS